MEINKGYNTVALQRNMEKCFWRRFSTAADFDYFQVHLICPPPVAERKSVTDVDQQSCKFGLKIQRRLRDKSRCLLLQ